MYDVAIIGAGIVGTAIARELAKYELRTVLIEKDSDVANGTSKANSAIVHAGYDAEPGTLKAKLNAEGNRMFAELSRELDVPFQRIGSFVIARNDDELETLHELYQRGVENEIPDLEIIGAERLREMEPGVSESAVAALYAPTAGITDPYLLTVALAESAAENGVDVRLESPVRAIHKNEAGFRIECGEESVDARYVVNAAGLYADRINEMVNSPSFTIRPTRGEYFLLDKKVGHVAQHVLFPCPTAEGKGVLITPTTHGNIIVGPNAEPVDSREAVETTPDGLDYVRNQATKLKEELPLGASAVITSFSGLRAKTDHGDFIIGESEETPGFVNVAGIDSPGLAASPAIATYVVDLLRRAFGGFRRRSGFKLRAKDHTPFMSLDDETKQKLIEQDRRYGRIICRCESITEGEIVRAIEGPVGARTLDGIKRRVRPGCGRCQGGFCGPRVIEILARELNTELSDIRKDNMGSYLLTFPTKGRLSKRRKNGAALGKPAEEHGLNVEHGGKDRYDVVVVGGGPAGMAAAISAYDNGVKDVLLIERDHDLGGILQQCIHNGFGLHYFKEELTGPEYSERFINQLKERGIACKLDTMVLSLGSDRTITYINQEEGVRTIQANAVVLGMGCRERTRGAISVPGTRPAGVFSAGTAQRLVNMEGHMVGRKVVVFGTGDVGLIMARHVVWEGAEMVAMVERKSYSEGLLRNYVQCVQDYNIPMLLRHTIVDIKGKDRVEGITIAETDDNKRPIPGTERDLECDTVLFSRGLICENELSEGAGVKLHRKTGGPIVNEAMETSVEGVFACGNVVHVHDLADWVTEESIKAGRGAARYIKEHEQHEVSGFTFETAPGNGVSYIVPHKVRTDWMDDTLELYLRVRDHHERVRLEIRADGQLVKSIKKKVLTPGQMDLVKIKRSDLPADSFGELSIEVVDGREKPKSEKQVSEKREPVKEESVAR